MMILLPYCNAVEHLDTLGPNQLANLLGPQALLMRLRWGVRDQAGRYLKHPVMAVERQDFATKSLNHPACLIAGRLVCGVAVVGEMEELKVQVPV